MDASTEHVRSAAKRRAQAGLACGAIAHFKKACGEIGAGEGIVRKIRERMSVGVGGIRIFAVQQQNASEFYQYFAATRRSIASLQKDRARGAAIVLLQVQTSEV